MTSGVLYSKRIILGSKQRGEIQNPRLYKMSGSEKTCQYFCRKWKLLFWPKEGKKVSIFCITILFNSHPCFTSSILCLENKMSTAMSLNLQRVQDGTWALKINILLIIIQQLKYFLSHYPIFSSNRLVPFSKFPKL